VDKGFFRKYGFGLILLALFLISVSAFWNQTYAYTRSEAEMHGQEWTKDDQETEFWNGFHENMQSEFGQLFVQFLGMVAFASWVAAKQDESQEENAYKGTLRALKDYEEESGGGT
jgi:hypothetical protein